MKACDCDIHTFKKWCKLSEKYDSNDPLFKDYTKFRYDERYLRSLAKMYNMELYEQVFDTKNDKINEYLMCDYTDFVRNNENSKYICHDEEKDCFKYYHDLESADVNVLHSNMGKGKTSYIRAKLNYLELL